MTLALLITAVTGAWADETPLLTIESTDYESFTSGSKTFDDKVTVTFSNEVDNVGDNWGWYVESGTPSLLTVAGINGYTITSCKFYAENGAAKTGYTVEGESPSVCLSYATVFTDANQSVNIGTYGIKKIEVYGGVASSEPTIEVTTNAASEQDLFTEASFTMPAFDATVNYELVRDLAVQTQFVGVPTEPVAVKKDGDKFVFASGTAPAIALIDLLADNAPIVDGVTYYFEKQNAETGDFEPSTVNLLQDAQPGTWRIVTTATADGPYDGTVYSSEFTVVEQYDLTVKPADDFSKGKIDAVTVGSETVTPDATTGEATKTGITPGTEVKLKAKRGYVIEKVEAKKTVIPMLNAATTENIGMVVCNKGHLHDAKTAVPDGCTAVGILGKVTETGHGLILALKDATSQTWNTINGWTSVDTYAGTTLKVLPDDDARGTNLASYTTLGATAVSNWAVAQKSDYDAIFTNLGSTKSDSDGTTYDANVNAYITTGVGGTAISGYNWSATEDDDDYAWYFSSGCWYGLNKSSSRSVRPVLGF